MLEIHAFPHHLFEKMENLKEPYKEYFEQDMKIKWEEIDKLFKDDIRLSALINLKSEAQKKIEEYRIEYMSFLESLGSWETNLGISEDKNHIEYSYERRDFWILEDEFSYSITNLQTTIKKIQIKLELQRRYNTNKVVEKEKAPLTNVNSEFLKLFRNQETATEFIKRLKVFDYISDSEMWCGISKKPGELRDAYFALQNLELLKPSGRAIKGIRIFYNRFGLLTREQGGDYISERALRNRTETDDYINFLNILKPLKHTT